MSSNTPQHLINYLRKQKEEREKDDRERDNKKG